MFPSHFWFLVFWSLQPVKGPGCIYFDRKIEQKVLVVPNLYECSSVSTETPLKRGAFSRSGHLLKSKNPNGNDPVTRKSMKKAPRNMKKNSENPALHTYMKDRCKLLPHKKCFYENELNLSQSMASFRKPLTWRLGYRGLKKNQNNSLIQLSAPFFVTTRLMCRAHFFFLYYFFLCLFSVGLV